MRPLAHFIAIQAGSGPVATATRAIWASARACGTATLPAGASTSRICLPIARCAGTYVFHRQWLDRVELLAIRSESFLFNFELLEKLRRAGSRFAHVVIRPFARDVGQSREVALRRMGRVFGEIVRCRVRDLSSGR